MLINISRVNDSSSFCDSDLSLIPFPVFFFSWVGNFSLCGFDCMQLWLMVVGFVWKIRRAEF